MSKPQMPKRPKANPRVLLRVLKMLFSFYPALVPITILCILISAVTAALPPVFMQRVIANITEFQALKTPWQDAVKVILPQVLTLALFYFVSLIAIILQTQLMAVITQGFLCKLIAVCSRRCRTCPSVTLTPTSTATSCRTTPTISTRCAS